MCPKAITNLTFLHIVFAIKIRSNLLYIMQFTVAQDDTQVRSSIGSRMSEHGGVVRLDWPADIFWTLIIYRTHGSLRTEYLIHM